MNGANLLQQYQSYDPTFVPMQAPASAGSGFAAAIPGIGLGLQGAGLLAGLYGAYKANQQADRQYRLQKQMFDRQVKQEDEDRKRAAADAVTKRMYDAAGYSQNYDGGRLAQYANYFRGIGL